MFKYRWMSKTQWLLKYVDERIVVGVWSRVKQENPQLFDEQIADRVEDYFGIRNYLQTDPD
jgi:hypothetical protein